MTAEEEEALLEEDGDEDDLKKGFYFPLFGFTLFYVVVLIWFLTFEVFAFNIFTSILVRGFLVKL